jgi:beta-lactamase class A
MQKLARFSALLILLLSLDAYAQPALLRQQIEQIAASKRADIGVSIIGIEDHDTLSVNGNHHFPMLSVFKFHVALTVLHQVDQGKFHLEQQIFVSKNDLSPNTWSPLREQYPNGNIWLPLSDLIEITVARSDNNACDLLLKLIGGTKTVNDFIHSNGIADVNIVATETEMHQAWGVQYRNWTSPIAASSLLVKSFKNKIVSPKSMDFLWRVMSDRKTSGHRIAGELPSFATVAHKTGTSDTNKKGITAAVNDVGIVGLPNGKHFAISVFVANSKEPYKTNEKIIADISRLAWDYFRSYSSNV